MSKFGSMSNSNTTWILSVSFVLAAIGFLLPVWPLCVAGIFLAAFSGRWLFAVCIGLLLDVAWGTPTGFGNFLLFPFTLSALLAGLGRYFSVSYVRRSSTDTL